MGIGTGLNLPFYPHAVRLTAVDLSPTMLAIAAQRAGVLDRPPDLLLGDAQALGLLDACFDTVVVTLSLGTIPDERPARGSRPSSARTPSSRRVVAASRAGPASALAGWSTQRRSIAGRGRDTTTPSNTPPVWSAERRSRVVLTWPSSASIRGIAVWCDSASTSAPADPKVFDDTSRLGCNSHRNPGRRRREHQARLSSDGCPSDKCWSGTFLTHGPPKGVTS
jgi:SAM-dependent methyltransferase